MNRVHRWYCRSNHWRRRLEAEMLPWVFDGLAWDPAAPVLELGPGPGLTTAWLRDRCADLKCLEIDDRLARQLQSRLGSNKLQVYIGDATRMPFGERRFTTVLSFTMLHHLASPSLQNDLFAETYRVLKPGGVFAGIDSRESFRLRLFHLGDTMMPIEPAQLPARLRAAKFEQVRVDLQDGRFRFQARRPPRRTG